MECILSWPSSMHSSILCYMETPFFPAFRARLAGLGQAGQFLRQQNLLHLEKLFAPLLPAGLLSQAEEGPNAVIESIASDAPSLVSSIKSQSRLPLPQVVRQIQALFALHNAGSVDEGSSAYCQARDRCP